MSTWLTLALFMAAANAQDVRTTLVGTWEGEIQQRGLPKGKDLNRTLVIESVSATEQGAVARGRYGVTGKRLQPVVIDVDPTGTILWMRFTTGGERPITLNLIGDAALSGTIRLRGGAKERPMLFRKLNE